jgi:hypothetical protein
MRAVLGAVAAALVAVSLLPGGCGKNQRPSTPTKPGPAVARGKAPAYEAVAAEYNKRTAPLERLYARTTLRVWYVDDQGQPQQVQVEGHFDYIRPGRLLMTYEKLGETYAVLGSNDEQYWWMEKGEQAKALVGDLAKATPERVRKLGLPVYPLDLIELLGITTIPASAPAVGAGEAGDVRWSEDGKSLLITISGGANRRVLWLDPQSYEPSRVDLIRPDKSIAATASLGSYQAVQLAGGKPGPRIATKINGSAPASHLDVRLTLYDPEISASRPRPAVFEIKSWLTALRVEPANLVNLNPPG